MVSGTEFASTGPTGPDTASLTPDNGWADPGQDRNDREPPGQGARAAGVASRSRRPWAITLLAVLVIAGAGALTGWQTRWPEAVFGVQKTAVIKPALGVAHGGAAHRAGSGQHTDLLCTQRWGGGAAAGPGVRCAQREHQ